MNFKMMMQLGLIAGLAATMTVACAPKKDKKTPIRRADGSVAKGAPTAEAMEKVLKAMLKDSYKLESEGNKKLAARLMGATLKLEDVVTDKKGEVGSAAGELQVVLKDKIEVLKALGKIGSQEQFSTLEVKNACDKKTDDFRIEGRCSSKTCDNVLVMVSEAVKSADGKATGTFNDMALLFRRTDGKKEHALVWSASADGKREKTGSRSTAIEAMTQLKGQGAHAEAEVNASCSTTTTTTEQTTASGAKGAGPSQAEIDRATRGAPVDTVSTTLNQGTQSEVRAADNAIDARNDAGQAGATQQPPAAPVSLDAIIQSLGTDVPSLDTRPDQAEIDRATRGTPPEQAEVRRVDNGIDAKGASDAKSAAPTEDLGQYL